MNNDDKHSDSGGVEVVANQADDGSFELSFERGKQAEKPEESGKRPSDSGEHKGKVVKKTSNNRDIPDEQIEPHVPLWRRPLTWLLASISILIAVIAVSVAVTALQKQQAPRTVEIEEPEFRGVFVDSPPMVVDEASIIEDTPDIQDSTNDTAAEERALINGEPAIKEQQVGEDEMGKPMIDDIVKTTLDTSAAKDSQSSAANPDSFEQEEEPLDEPPPKEEHPQEEESWNDENGSEPTY